MDMLQEFHNAEYGNKCSISNVLWLLGLGTKLHETQTGFNFLIVIIYAICTKLWKWGYDMILFWL